MSSANNQRFEDSFQGANLVAARMLKRLDMTAQAHRTTRRSFEWTGSPHWPSQPSFESWGRLAALVGKIETAVNAYRRHLALRQDPNRP
jgi:hypothetical protein